MHRDEVTTDAALVRHLLASQFPQWADRPITRVASAGTDNAMYRLGDDLAVRLPRIHWAVDAVTKEQTWLPRIAAELPLAVPLPVAAGEPDERFPYPWTVVQWLAGDLATLDRLDDPVRCAHQLAEFVIAVRAVGADDGPRHFRGGPVRAADAAVRTATAEVHGEVDAVALERAWERTAAAPDHAGPPVWFHGDLAYLNLLARNGRLSAVIDWGTCGVGDPAIDTTIAWTLFPPDARAAYREALGVDDATWARGQAWVLTGVIGIPYYRETNPTLVADKVRGIEQVLAEPV